jgi:hypothetical protein
MTDEAIVPKPDQKRKQKSGFRSFTEGEFDERLAKLIEENKEMLLALGKNDLISSVLAQ